MLKARKRHDIVEPRLSILSPDYAQFQLHTVLDSLNSPTTKVPQQIDDSRWDWQSVDRTDLQRELKRLIADWMESGQNLEKLFRKHPNLREKCIHGRTLLIPARDGIAQLAWFPHDADHRDASQKDLALTYFIQLMVNPLALYLGGPCARCGKFYIKKTKRQKVYCSRGCGAAITALSATQKRRQTERVEKILLAEKLILQWIQTQTRTAWKNWVNIKSKGGISVKWLTRAVGSGEINPPLGA